MRDFLAALNKFNPRNFVNESEQPTRDELVELGLKAVMNMRELVKKNEDLQARHSELYVDALAAHVKIQDLGISAPSLAEAFEKVTGRHQQALDILNSIATMEMFNITMASESMQSMAKKFLGYVTKRNEEDAGSTIIRIGGDNIKDPKEIQQAMRANAAAIEELSGDSEAVSGPDAQPAEVDPESTGGSGGDTIPPQSLG